MVPVSIPDSHVAVPAFVQSLASTSPLASIETRPASPEVPFYSQFKDISSSKWKKVGCGVTSLAMIIDYYDPGAVSVDKLLSEGITAGAYLKNAGWTYAGLIDISKKYGMSGETHDLTGETKSDAYAELRKELKDGPIIASVHYKFDPKNPIPHLVVITSIKDDTVYYNDPAAKNGGKSISAEQFQKAWKQRFIVVRPSAEA